MDEHVIKNYVRQPEVFVSGDGALLRDQDGNEWLDLLGGIAVNALGHAHPGLVAALREQAGNVLHLSNLYRHPFTEDVAGRLARLTGLDAVYFCNSGAEANEAALKLARKHQRLQGRAEQTGFVSVEGGFHGRTMGALSITANARYREPFGPLIPGVTIVPRHDRAALEAAFAQPPAAFVVEPIQGEAGIKELDPAYLDHARALCRATGALFVADEVQTGCGRTGTFLRSQALGLDPDVVTLAKPLGGGVPIGAMVVAEPLAGVLVPGDHGSTFAGGPLALCAAQVLLRELEDGLQEQVVESGGYLRAGLEQLAADFPHAVAAVRGVGLMLALHLPDHAAAVQQKLHREHRILANNTGDAVRFLPPYVIRREQLDRTLVALRTVLASLPCPTSST